MRFNLHNQTRPVMYRWLIFILLCLWGCTNSQAQDPQVRIVLAGDSTVTDDAGWGSGFQACLADKGECINLSRGGRSSTRW